MKIKNKGTNQKDTIALLTNRKEIKRWGADLFHESQTRQRQDHETAIHDGGLKKV